MGPGTGAAGGRRAASSCGWRSRSLGGSFTGCGVPFNRLPFMVVGVARAPDLGLRAAPIPPDAAEVLHARPALVGMTGEELVESREQVADHVRPDRVVEHRRGAYLHGAATQHEVG